MAQTLLKYLLTLVYQPRQVTRVGQFFEDFLKVISAL